MSNPCPPACLSGYCSQSAAMHKSCTMTTSYPHLVSHLCVLFLVDTDGHSGSLPPPPNQSTLHSLPDKYFPGVPFLNVYGMSLPGFRLALPSPKTIKSSTWKFIFLPLSDESFMIPISLGLDHGTCFGEWEQMSTRVIFQT